MPNVGITGNFDAVKRKLALTKQQCINATKAGMRAGMHEINQIQVRTQMRGRPGLNMRHGGGAGLSGSWFINEVHGLTDSVYRLATRSKYARIHQYGGVIRPVKAKRLAFKIDGKFYTSTKVTMPKRLHLLEHFKTQGRQIILQNILRQFRKITSGPTKGTK